MMQNQPVLRQGQSKRNLLWVVISVILGILKYKYNVSRLEVPSAGVQTPVELMGKE